MFNPPNKEVFMKEITGCVILGPLLARTTYMNYMTLYLSLSFTHTDAKTHRLTMKAVDKYAKAITETQNQL